MSTRIIALILLVVFSVGFAFAEDSVYSVDAVVVYFEISSFGDLEITVVDSEGDIWVYYSDEALVGDVVVLRIFNFEDLPKEDDEIVGVDVVDHLSIIDMINWIKEV